MNSTIVLLDETNGATTSDGGKLTGALLSQYASALNIFANRDVGFEYGGGPVLVRVGSNDLQPDEFGFHIRATLPDAPGAVADHQDVLGQPYAEDGIALSNSLSGAGNSLTVALSHEIGEMIGDPGCNLWADRGDGVEVAQEICDPVEVQSYEIVPGIFVSNFVRHHFWIPGSVGPWDWMSYRGIAGAVSPRGPMQLAPGNGGNYMITRTSSASISQVTGMLPVTFSVSVTAPFGMRRPHRHNSRRARRGVPLPGVDHAS